MSTASAMPHNYFRRLLDLLPALLAQVQPGHVYQLDILHDDECPFLSGGRCTCSPSFSITDLSTPGGEAP
jgi:hypothetical protein